MGFAQQQRSINLDIGGLGSCQVRTCNDITLQEASKGSNSSKGSPKIEGVEIPNGSTHHVYKNLGLFIPYDISRNEELLSKTLSFLFRRLSLVRADLRSIINTIKDHLEKIVP